LNKITTFLQLIKFEHSLFALPFAYLGLFLACGGWPGWFLFGVVTIAMVSMRTSAMGLNRLIDLRFDALNPRTESRVVAMNLVTQPMVWFVTVLSFGVFLFSVARLHPMCLKLAPIPIVMVWVYPYLKKFTWLSHLFLGTILGIAPYGGWLAARGDWSWIPGLLAISVTTWVTGFDLFYALQDMEFDRRQNLKSFPARFGVKPTLIATRILHGMTLASLALLGSWLGLGVWYWAGWVVICTLILKEHQLVARFGLKKINVAFFNMNAWVSVVLFAAVITDLLVK
jgi:4-hydroxybenzoate polyprenyltransferase